MTGGLICIGTAAVIFLNRKRIISKLRKSDLVAWGFTFMGLLLVILAAHLYLTGGR